MQRELGAEFNVAANRSYPRHKDAVQIASLVKEVEPDLVINFASITTVRESFLEPLGATRSDFSALLTCCLHSKRTSSRAPC